MLKIQSANVSLVATFFVGFSCFRLVCKIQKMDKPGWDQKIVLEVHEGEVEGRYSIEGRAQIQGFSFVVRKFCLLTRSGAGISDAMKCCNKSSIHWCSGAKHNRPPA